MNEGRGFPAKSGELEHGKAVRRDLDQPRVPYPIPRLLETLSDQPHGLAVIHRPEPVREGRLSRPVDSRATTTFMMSTVRWAISNPITSTHSLLERHLIRISIVTVEDGH
jgi:hypothetical protein